jgi:hypothetical protein
MHRSVVNTLRALSIVPDIEEGLRRGARWGTKFAEDYRRRTGSTSRTGEVDVLLGLFVHGLPYMRATLGGPLADLGLSLRMGWVYCHQSPIVGWTDDTGTHLGCEIGDLLIVVRNTTVDRISRRALLVQFKITGGSYGLTDAQGRLYTEWPVFRYTRPSRPTWRRSVHPKRGHRGAQIGLFVRCGGCGEPHGEMRCDIPGGSEIPLARELAALLLDGGGREFGELAAVRRTQGWDRVVWDLINETTAATLNYHGHTAARRDFARAAREALDLYGVAFAVMPEGLPGLMAESSSAPGRIAASSLARYDEGPPPDLPRKRLDDPSSGGISTLFIDIGEAPDDEERGFRDRRD